MPHTQTSKSSTRHEETREFHEVGHISQKKDTCILRSHCIWNDGCLWRDAWSFIAFKRIRSLFRFLIYQLSNENFKRMKFGASMEKGLSEGFVLGAGSESLVKILNACTQVL